MAVSVIRVVLVIAAMSNLGEVIALPHVQGEKRSLGAQRLTASEPAFPVDVTPDGRAVILVTQAFGRGTDEDPSQLLMRDLRTGETTRLSVGASSFGPGGRPAGVFSPDAAQFAHVWTDRSGPSREQVTTNLSVTQATGGGTHRTLAGPGAVPHGWSPDGKAILFLQHALGARITDTTSLNWLSVADRSVTLIKTLEPWRSGANALPRLSPDGKWIAYSAFSAEGSVDRYVYVIDANGENLRPAATLAGMNTQPIWTADSSHLLFVNSRGDHRRLYATSVAEMGTLGDPVLLDADFSGDLLRVSTSGRVFYTQSNDGRLQTIAERSSNAVRVMESFKGTAGMWSTTGQLAFLRLGADGFLQLVVRSPRTGQERSYRHPSIGTAPPRWFSDETTIVVHVNANGDGGRPGGSFYGLDAKTGSFTRLFAKDSHDALRSFVGVLSPDNKTFYLASRSRNPPVAWSHIGGVDLATGVERIIVTLPEPGLPTPPALALTNDGATLAIRTDDGRIMTARVHGSSNLQLVGRYPPLENPYGRDAAGSPVVMRWTPDGRSIVFGVTTPAPGIGWRIVKTHANGGDAEPDGLGSSNVATQPTDRSMKTLVNFDLSADGSQIVFSTRGDQTYEVWALDNVSAASRTPR